MCVYVSLCLSLCVSVCVCVCVCSLVVSRWECSERIIGVLIKSDDIDPFSQGVTQTLMPLSLWVSVSICVLLIVSLAQYLPNSHCIFIAVSIYICFYLCLWVSSVPLWLSVSTVSSEWLSVSFSVCVYGSVCLTECVSVWWGRGRSHNVKVTDHWHDKNWWRRVIRLTKPSHNFRCDTKMFCSKRTATLQYIITTSTVLAR